MTLSGQIRGGQIVLSGNPELPEGADVRIELEVVRVAESEKVKELPPLGQKLMEFAGKAVGLPRDAARNHDHYRYGTPKR